MAGAGGRLSAVPGDDEREAAALVESVLQSPRIDAGHAVLVELGHRLPEYRRRLSVDVLVRFDVYPVAAPPNFDRLVDELSRRADRDPREEILDVLRVQPDAAVAHLHADAPRDVGAMDAVRRQGQLQAILAEGVVRSAAGDEGPRVAALDDVLLADRFWDVPLRVDGLADHLEASARSLPVIAPEADGIGAHHRRPGAGRRVVEEPHLGNVDDDALVRAARQDPFHGQQHHRAGRRYPRIEAGIGVDDLVVAEAVEPSDVHQRVALPDPVQSRLAHDRRQAAGRRRGDREGGEALAEEHLFWVAGRRDP